MTPTSLDKNNRCYSRTELKDYSLGRASELVSIRIEEHLNECDICEDTIVALDSSEDTFVHQLRGVSAGTDHEKNSELDVLLAGAKKLVDQSMAVQPNGQSINGYQQIGEYELCELVGRGGMGQVYRARHSRLDKEFALKILSGKRFSNDEAIGRFQREMKIVGKLDHPSIVQATDAGEFDEVHYLTMEYVDGHNAAKVLHHCDPLAVGDACEIVRQACDGIEYAHQQDIVHRDIKPSNLMLNRKGQVKILDLGLATLRNINHSVDELTTVGQLMGTLDYMAPEQCDGQMVDHRCDIYSLGSTLYKLLTNRAPYSKDDNQSPLQKLRAMAVEDFIPITRHRDDLPSELVDIIHRCLDRDPENRYASAAELSEALKPFCDGHDLGTLIKQTEKEVESAKSKAIEFDGSRAFQGEEYTDTVVSGSLQADAGGQGSRVGIGWIAALIMLALVPLAWLSIQIIINWDNGQLVIESETGNVQVKLIKDGKPYKEMSLQQGANSTKIRAGKYEILIDDPSDQLVVTNGTFELKRGGTTIAKVVAKDGDGLESTANHTVDNTGQSQTNVDANTNAGNYSQITYEGKTFSDWLKENIDAGSYTALVTLGKDLDDRAIKLGIRQQIEKIKNERSREQNYGAFALICRLCRDKETAIEILDCFNVICKRYSAEEILGGGGSTTPLLDHNRIISLSRFVDGLEKFEDISNQHARNCLTSTDPALRAYGCMRLRSIWHTNPDLVDLDSVVGCLTNFARTENEATRVNAINNLCVFSENEKAVDYLAETVASTTGEVRFLVLYTLANKRPDLDGLAEMMLDDFDSAADKRQRQLLRATIRAMIQSNSIDFTNGVAKRLSDPGWGWQMRRGNYDEEDQIGVVSSQSQTRLNQASAEIELTWRAQHDFDGFDSNREEQSRTFHSIRYSLLDEIAGSINAGEGQSLLPTLKKERDLKYNLWYLNLVIATVHKIDPKNEPPASVFWFDTWIETNDEKIKERAAAYLSQSMDFRHVPSIRTFLDRMQKVNCVNPDERELEIIQFATNCFVQRGQTHSASIYRNIEEFQKEDAAFLLCVLGSDRWESKSRVGRSSNASRRVTNPKVMDFFQNLDSPILTIRAIDLELINPTESWKKLLESDLSDEIRPLVYQYFATWAFDADVNRFARSNSEVVTPTIKLTEEMFETTDPLELYFLFYCLRSGVQLEDLDIEKQQHADTAFQFNKARLIRFLIDRSDMLTAKPKFYPPHVWHPNLQKEMDNESAVLWPFVEAMHDNVFAEENFQGQKEKIIENLKKLVPSIESRANRSNANNLLNAIENSQENYTIHQLGHIVPAAREFSRDVGEIPSNVIELIKCPERIDQDKWKGPYLEIKEIETDVWNNSIRIIEGDERNPIIVVSAGPDGEFESKDDLQVGEPTTRLN